MEDKQIKKVRKSSAVPAQTGTEKNSAPKKEFEKNKEQLEKENQAILDQAEKLLKEEAALKHNSEKISSKTKNINKEKENTTLANQNDFQKINEQIGSLKSKISLLTTALVITIAGSAFAYYYINEHKFDDLKHLNQSILASEKSALEAESRINILYSNILEKDKRADRLFTDNADLKAQNNAIKNNQENLKQLVEKTVEENDRINTRLNNYEDRNPNDWLIAKSFNLISTAQNIIQFSNDIKSALLCLEQADLLLVKIDEAKINAVREAISQDQMALQNIPFVDVKGLSFKLDSVYDNTDKMPLNEFLDSNHAENSFKKENEPTAQLRDWKMNLWSSVKEFSSRFIEVRRRSDTVVNQFLSPDQTKILLKNVKTEILLAKVALVNQDEQSFTHSVNQVITHIKSYFDVNNEIVQANIDALNELLNTKITTEKPQALKSYELMNAVVQDRFHLYKDQKKSKEVQAK
ncbi:MAG: uroporphyrinogen-III C-methyltransferase [Succinivibrio sp.]